MVIHQVDVDNFNWENERSKMKAWKVLRRDRNRKYWSCVVGGRARVRYFVGERVMSPNFLRKRGYELLVFSDKLYAESFRQGRTNCVIREVRVGKPKMFMPIILNTWDLDRGSFTPGAGGWPTGTRMVPWVKLLRKKRWEK